MVPDVLKPSGNMALSIFLLLDLTTVVPGRLEMSIAEGAMMSCYTEIEILSD